MGACLSVSSNARSLSLQDVEHELSTGDIIMFSDGSKTSKYLFKALPVGGWTHANKVGFLVRNGPGDEGLMVYHTDEPCSNDVSDSSPARVRTKVKGENLASELSSGRYRLAVVRCLHRRLTDDQVALVKEFVALNEGKTFDDDPQPSSILMASSSSGSTAFERLCCSEFVAMMLHLVGAVAPTDIPFEYAATHAKGKLIRSTMVLQLTKDGTTSTANRVTLLHDQSSQGTDTPSPSTSSPGDAGSPHHPESFVSAFSTAQKTPAAGVSSEAISVMAM